MASEEHEKIFLLPEAGQPADFLPQKIFYLTGGCFVKANKAKVLQKVGKGLLGTVLALAIGAGGTAGYFAYAKNANMTIRLNEGKKFQTFTGWGSSACWWAQKTPDDETRDQIARLLYSKEGLGLNIYRYNIGGGYDPEKERVDNPWRLTESFYIYNEKSGKWEYDFTRDANAQKMLDAALSYGCIDTVVLFANSPHYTMTVSGLSSGGMESYQSNLKEDCYEAYVDSFLTITEYFLKKGVPVKMISPINEPQWSWGGDWVGQEGCHYEEEEALHLLHLFAEGIEKRNLPVTLCAPESGNIGDTTKRYFENMIADETIRANLGTLAYHSYFSDDDRTAKTKLGSWIDRNAEGVPVAMSEWCELPCVNDTTSIQAALRMARVMAQDLTCTGVNSWSAWVAVNQHGAEKPAAGKDFSDGMLSAADDFSEFYLTMRYHAMAHFAKYIPAGSVRIGASSAIYPLVTTKTDDGKRMFSTSVNYAAFLTPDGKAVLVVVNEGAARSLTLTTDRTQMTVIQTDAQKQEETVYEGDVKTLTLPENSLITIVLS